MIEHCKAVPDALATIHTLEELEGYATGLGIKPKFTREEWALVAKKKIELAKREGKNGHR
jgi:gamma-glutamylcysteine synthetase